MTNGARPNRVILGSSYLSITSHCLCLQVFNKIRMKKTIAILGATGTQGASVVDAFHASPDWHIRALTRNPTSAKAQAIPKSERITILKADTSDWFSLLAAFEGCDAIFAVTDYWAPFSNARLRKQHAVGPDPGKALREWAYEDEINHGKNIAKAATVCAVNGKLKHFIWSGLPSPKQYSNGKYSGIYHFDSKAEITEHIKKYYPALAKVMSVLFVGFYASNMLVSQLMKPLKREDGTFLVQRLCDGDAKHPFIITREHTGPLAKALIEAAPGKTLLGYTAMVSWREMTEMWARATGQTAVFREIGLEEFKKQFPVEGEELLSATYSAEFGYAGRDPTVIDPPAMGFKNGPEVIEAWMGKQDWSSVLDTASQNT
jgi:NAD(P)-dependent dehydrogenase (short-subunit alcohol dehydrogenase family)